MSPPGSLFSFFRKPAPRATASRANKRLTIGTPAQLRVPGDSDRTSQAVILEDISDGGARLHTPRQLKVGKMVDLVLNLGYKKELELRGVIKYASVQAIGFQSCYGLRFTAIPEEKRELLRNYIESNACNIGRR